MSIYVLRSDNLAKMWFDDKLGTLAQARENLANKSTPQLQILPRCADAIGAVGVSIVNGMDDSVTAPFKRAVELIKSVRAGPKVDQLLEIVSHVGQRVRLAAADLAFESVEICRGKQVNCLTKFPHPPIVGVFTILVAPRFCYQKCANITRDWPEPHCSFLYPFRQSDRRLQLKPNQFCVLPVRIRDLLADEPDGGERGYRGGPAAKCVYPCVEAVAHARASEIPDRRLPEQEPTENRNERGWPEPSHETVYRSQVHRFLRLRPTPLFGSSQDLQWGRA